MGLTRGTALVSKSLLLLINFCFYFGYGAAIDTVTSTQFIKDPQAIVSNGGVFKLGFFTPANSTNRYVGIWFNSISVMTVVWVANRNRPLKDSSGIMTISEDGNLVVLNGQKEILWSSNVSNLAAGSSAQLFNDGSLVLQDNTTGKSVWESFQQPCDTFLPKMQLSTDVKTGEKVQLTSWKSPSDPAIGSFAAGIDPLAIPEIFIWKNGKPYWRSGPWNGNIFIGIYDMYSVYLDGFNLLYDREGTVYFTYANDSFLSPFVLSSDGQLAQTNWDGGKSVWENEWWALHTECNIYGKCGPFGSCNFKSSPICSCLRGFEPKNKEEWNGGNWSSGCVRKRPLQCQRERNSTTTTGTHEVGKEDGFLKLEKMKMPDFAEPLSVLEHQCKEQCLKNCSCVAYAYDTGIGCMFWSGNLIDLQKFPTGGADLYIRVAHSELDKKVNMKVVIIIAVIVGTVAITVCIFLLWRWMSKRREMKEKKNVLSFNRGEAHPTEGKLEELPLFDFEKLATATSNFHPANKLGQGGFGPVYRGKLENGQEIAVKRLSKASGQGVEEFMNEVMVISKLQHRNLVKLLGCCVGRDEKLLIYEFMPNGSLDTFLFDPCKQDFLNWEKRFNIIQGISRGLLYLHRDSRLRIIHRDLKASNILLDEEMNPKISDFGMARIFGSNEDQDKTKRVVGTYGYMSPEYAMEGRFSEKSDVFSFGVLLLEIISGKRNSSFYNADNFLTLLRYVWKLWNEDKIVDLINPTINDSCFHKEILRCIQVGLLCVQEFVKDRPTVSTIISMLNSEILDLPTPKQPAFTEHHIASDTESSQLSHKKYSVNQVTLTTIEGR